MDEETAKKLLEVLSEEDLLFLASKKTQIKKGSSAETDTDFSTFALKPSERFYARNQITGSNKRCPGCGQSLVNDEIHATALLGSDLDLLNYLSVQEGLDEKEEVNN